MSKSPTKAGSLTPRLPNRLTGDEALASRIHGGDPAAFDEMFRRYHQAIYQFCSSMVGPEDAKDMLQNVMTKAMTSMPENEDFQMKPWLYRVARNECIDHLRTAKRTESGLEADRRPDLSDRRDPHRATLDRERLSQLVTDLNSLPEKQRATLVMRELSGLGYQDIAESMDTTEAGAKQLVYEARLSLEQAHLGRNLDCAEVRESVSSLDRRRLRGRKIRSHMRSCESCAEFERSIRDRQSGFASLAPVLPIGAAAGILGAIREGGSATGMAGAGAASGVAATGIGSGIVAKGMVAVVVAGGVGVGTAEVVRHQDAAGTAGSERSSTVDPGLAPASGIVIPPELAFGNAGNSPEKSGPGSGNREGPGTGRRVGAGIRNLPGTPAVANPGSGVSRDDVGSGDRITPGQGSGSGPSTLPEASEGGQPRADEASSAVPGQTGNPPPSSKPSAPPGQSGTAGQPATSGGGTQGGNGQSASAPATGKPESPGKSGK